MAAGTASRYIVTPGRLDDFVRHVREARDVIAGLGGTLVLRRTQVGGEASGQLGLTIFFDDARKRAEALERVRTENLLASMAAAVQGANPPAQITTRAWLEEVGESGGIPEPKTVLSTSTLLATPGHAAEAVSALEAARKKHNGMGIPARLFRVSYGGALSGAFIYGMSYDSLPQMQDFIEANAAAAPLPIADAIGAGALTSVSRTVSFAIDL